MHRLPDALSLLPMVPLIIHVFVFGWKRHSVSQSKHSPFFLVIETLCNTKSHVQTVLECVKVWNRMSSNNTRNDQIRVWIFSLLVSFQNKEKNSSNITLTSLLLSRTNVDWFNFGFFAWIFFALILIVHSLRTIS